MPSAARVLIVEDEQALRETVAEAFELEGYLVDTAANGQEALRKIESQPPQVIVLDLMMPVMDGVEFLTECRADPRCGRVPVVVTSAHRQLAEIAPKLEVAACIAKPFDLFVLIGAVDKLLQTRNPSAN